MFSSIQHIFIGQMSLRIVWVFLPALLHPLGNRSAINTKSPPHTHLKFLCDSVETPSVKRGAMLEHDSSSSGGDDRNITNAGAHG